MKLTARADDRTGRRLAGAVVAAVTSTAVVVSLTAVTAAADEVPPVPVVHYAFDDDPASGVVTDSSGRGYDAVLENPAGASSVPGADGAALSLAGGSSSTGAHVRLPREVLASATDLTVSLRVRWGGGGAWQWMYALGTDTSRYLFSTPATNGGDLRTAVTTRGGGGEATVTGESGLPTEEWRTVTAVVDTTAEELTMYLDGAEVSSASTTVTAAELLTDAAEGAGYIGRSFYPDPLFAGAVDDFQVFHSALTAEQVDDVVLGDTPTVVAVGQPDLELRTVVGTAPALPARVTASFSDGYDRQVPATWDPVEPEDYASPGTFTVRGLAAGAELTAQVLVQREGELTIDLGSDTGDFLGGASGVLYGLYDEGMPTDTLIEGFGLRTVATKGQDGSQHPGSDALEVLDQLATTTDGKIYVRTTDYYRGFPYQWPGDTPDQRLEGYFAVMQTQLDQIAALLDERPDLVDNVVVEPFNEPEGNMFGTGEWSYDRVSWLDDPTDFFAAWDRSHALITETLPGVQVAGPGTSLLFDQVEGFMTHTLAAGTLPDIVTWHELSNPGQVRTSVDRYRAWEAELFEGTELAGRQLPININEYAFNYHTSVPGQMVQWISALEDSKVEAMIAFWNMNGNLADSAVRTNHGNGQWWLYNAYSSMTGHTVEVSPPSPNESYTLQGVATLDEDRALARAVIGGAGGGSYVQLADVPADVFGEQVRVTVREIPWSGQLGEATQPRHVAELTAEVVQGTVALDFGGAAGLPALTESSAYEILVTPAGTGTSTSQAPLAFEASYEAEDGLLGGSAQVNGPEGSPSNLGGFYTSGGRDVGGFRTGSDGSVEVQVEVPQDGVYDLAVYASSLNLDPDVAAQGPTNIFVSVDGAAEREVFLPLSYKWVVWDHADTEVELTAGVHRVRLAARSLDGARSTVGDAIIDRVVVSQEDPTAAGVYEAELAQLAGAPPRYDVVDPPVSGAGAVEVGGAGEVTFWVNADVDGEHTLTVDGAGSARVSVDGVPAGDVAGGDDLHVHLAGGVNKVVVQATGASLLLDRLVVTHGQDVLPVNEIQAEAAALAGTTTIVDLGLAEGGRAVDGIGGTPGNANTLTLDVVTQVTGPHAVTVRFSNPEQMPATHYNPNPMGRRADISVNGGPERSEMFVPTFHQNNFWERTIVLDLAEGANTITFSSEEETNWDGDTYAQDLWPGLPLRADTAPVLDRFTITPFSSAQLESDVGTETSIADVLAQDTEGPQLPPRADPADFDLLAVAVDLVLDADPQSAVAVLADPTKATTVLMPDDAAMQTSLGELLGRPVSNERTAARFLGRLDVGDLESLLLDHVVPGRTLTVDDLLLMDGETVVTAGGTTLVVSVVDGVAGFGTTDGAVLARTAPGRPTVNAGQAQVGVVIDQMLVTGS